MHLYGNRIFEEVMRYAHAARRIALHYDFDVIHAHDWLSIKAGIEAKHVKNKPLFFHVHATEFDRTGGNNVYSQVFAIEQEGMRLADEIITVSNVTKQAIIQKYEIDSAKITVIYHAVPIHAEVIDSIAVEKLPGPVVLFIGRLTLQKGPDYFVAAAHKVLQARQDITFIIAGSGDMEKRLIDQAAHLGIADQLLFTGFLVGEQALKVIKMADLLVMPSVSEPFGLVTLEAIRAGVPCIVAKNAGVCEVINDCLKVDFWDINAIANQILAVIEYKELHHELQHNALQNIQRLSWQKAGQECMRAYQKHR
jgi:glycosyltransferase involved in cell wall biosynthesis